jgi:hypothetical protein
MIVLEGLIIEGLTHDDPTPAVVRAALQRALELEHSTIPPYLYALYSLKPGCNLEVSRVLESVVIEEMLHMVLVSNILNALGGAPELATPSFIPRYPGRLPGGVEQHLTVHLAPFSFEQLQVFIEIEEPRSPLDHEGLLQRSLDETCTIGEFYTLIRRAITRLDPSAFATSPRHQVGPTLVFGSVEVVDAVSADAALDIIISQGEGTATSPEEVAGFGGVNDVAHYYRFLELQRGRRMVRQAVNCDTFDFDFTGEPLVFDPDGVWDIATDPSVEGHPPGSKERLLLERFNYTYTALLHQLDWFLNGHSGATEFATVLELMRSLSTQARFMVSGATSSHPLGPTFEYQLFTP